jgi:hypothetical protein
MGCLLPDLVASQKGNQLFLEQNFEKSDFFQNTDYQCYCLIWQVVG